MHELSFVSEALDAVLNATPKDHPCRVLTVEISIGVFSSYVEDAIRLHWHQLSQGTKAEAAYLKFHHLPGELQCLFCQQQFPASNRHAQCLACGDAWTVPITGEDCRVDAIDIEDMSHACIGSLS
jgi:Zn finger protein HypA/HybF involved in hydrogenase expression